MSLSENFEFRTILQEEAEQAIAIEQICFAAREACSPESMRQRIKRAPNLFLVALHRRTGKIAGFINGLSTNEGTFRDEFFTDASLYDPAGKNIMLLGVAVLPEYQGLGLARDLMARFIQKERVGEVKRSSIILTCHQSKTGMYQKMGFADKGLSSSSWGGEAWHEMVCVV